MAFLDETGLTELWSLIQDADDAVFDSVAKVEFGSYVGTGKSGSSNPNSLTFGEVPKLVMLIGYNKIMLAGWETSNTTDRYHAMFPTLLTTSWEENMGFGHIWNSEVYGKRSSDSKTIYWYNTSSTVGYQYNASGVTYHYMAIY